jgi:hypothetical protein
LASIEFTAIGLFPVMGEVNMHHILADNDALLTFWQESFQVQVALGRPWNGTVKCQKPPFFVLMIYTNMAKLGMVDPIAFRTIAESCYTMPGAAVLWIFQGGGEGKVAQAVVGSVGCVA